MLFFNAIICLSSFEAVALKCNGLTNLCNKKYDKVYYAASHNSMSHWQGNWVPPNNLYGIITQLNDGIRALLLDTYYFKHSSYLCHGSCALGYQSLFDGLLEIKKFLDSNPREIITIVFENYIDDEDMAKAFDESGLMVYAHSQNKSDPWPILGQMIDNNKRLVVFTSKKTSNNYFWYLDENDFMWSTDWDNQKPQDFSCNAKFGSTSSSLFLLNHFLTNPFALISLAEEVNYNPFLIDRINLCKAEASQMPNFIAVDFYSIGDTISTVLNLNSAL
ncbi:hypothetical protein JYT19_00275 [Sulfobacillus acidophilus]|uniref:Phosphatidylinositol diacylglycerol-lyase n=1 Tax=Sulfobacillus acidophilus TaxID=53633 RepID=A0ABS3AVE7_9FIRM|nr:hypothetical protein [Sulfobacillus acidophilus]